MRYMLSVCRTFQVPVIWFASVVCSSILWSGCGGGGSQSQSTTPSFVLSASPTSLSLAADSTSTVTVTVAGENGFTAAVTIQLSGLPSGVSCYPTTASVSAGSSQQFTLTASATAPAASQTVTASGTSGNLSAQTQLKLTVSSSSPSLVLSRTRYVRTDSATAYPAYLNRSWIVFDSPTKRFFVADASGNRVVVLDSTTRTVIGSITAPGAFGIDETPDHSLLWVGTQIGDVYALDPVKMQIVRRYRSSEIGTSGFMAYIVRVLSDGRLALLGAQGGIPSVDGYGAVVAWNPSTNQIQTYPGQPVGHIDTFTLTGDRARIVLAPVGGGSVFLLDPTTGTVAETGNLSNQLTSIASSPDGKSVAVVGGLGITVLDGTTLAQKNTFALSGGDVSSEQSMIIGPDSQTLYIEGYNFLFAYNLTTGAKIGWMPNVIGMPLYSGLVVAPNSNAVLGAFDETGILAGPMEQGVGFVDTTALQTTTTGTEFNNGYVTPATGPVSGGTQVSIDTNQTATPSAIFFGGNQATALGVSGGLFYATAPPGPAGPVDVTGIMTDGGQFLFSEAFSYGPAILEVTPNMATAEGGGMGVIYGYGFGPTNATTIPSSLQVSVGGKPSVITGYQPNAYEVEGQPFPLQAILYTIPAGTSGTSGDVIVTSASGSVTKAKAIQYLPPVQQYAAAPGSSLAQGVFDSKRNLYYFTDKAQILVFSRSSRSWLSPIAVPAAPAGTSHRLWGISISPSGNMLAVSDIGVSMIYYLNPDSPSNVQSYAVSTYISGIAMGSSGPSYAVGLAASDAGAIYFGTYNASVSGADSLFKWDTASSKLTDYGVTTEFTTQLQAVIAPDNSLVYFADDGFCLSVDTVTDTANWATVYSGPGGGYDVSVSAEQNAVYGAGYFYDAAFNANSFLAMNDREELNIGYVFGAKLNYDGTFLFQPSTEGMDIFDGRLGILLKRISLPVTLAENFQALVANSTDNVVVALTGVTGSGIAVIDLTSLAEPSALPYLGSRREARPSSASHERARISRRGSPTNSLLPTNRVKYMVNAQGRTRLK